MALLTKPEDGAKVNSRHRAASWTRLAGATKEFRTWQDRVKARDAAIEILLPVAAVAFGMSILAVIVHFTAH